MLFRWKTLPPRLIFSYSCMDSSKCSKFGLRPVEVITWGAPNGTFRFREVMLKMWMFMFSRGLGWLLLLYLLASRLYSRNFYLVS